MAFYIFLGLCLIIICAIGYAIYIYNQLVALKHLVIKAWANIDILLKQRHDELPKLVELCKQYMKYEAVTLEKVVLARSAVATARHQQNIKALCQAESGLRTDLGQLFAVVENYPELKANESFQHLTQRISLLENSIADRRELYNDAVNQNNIGIEQFSDAIIARLFSFKAADLLPFSEAEIADVDMKALFRGD